MIAFAVHDTLIQDTRNLSLIQRILNKELLLLLDMTNILISILSNLKKQDEVF